MKQPNFTYLLAGIFACALTAPLIQLWSVDVGHLLANVGFSMLLVFGVFSLAQRRSVFYFGCFLMLVSMGLAILNTMTDHKLVLVLMLITILLFCLTSTWIAATNVFTAGDDISLNKVAGALCVYLLLGVIWAILFTVLELVSPGSFSGLSREVGSDISDELVYYSFVTLSTLGYGDITPARPLARVLAYSEALIGQFYLAVLVAGLVGAHVSTRLPTGVTKSPDPSPEDRTPSSERAPK